jgi:hypothetical protein
MNLTSQLGEKHLVLAIVAAFALGSGLVAYLLLVVFGDVLSALADRLRRRSPLLRLEPGPVRVAHRVAPAAHRERLGRLAWMAAGVLGAALARDPLLSVYALGIGAVMAWRTGGEALSKQRAVVSEQLEALVWRFKAIHSTARSVMDSVEISASKLPEGLLKQAAMDSVARARMARGDMRDLLKPLSELGDPHVEQFTFILERIELSDTDTVQSVLSEFHDRLRTRRVLRGRARASMSAVNLTRNVLLGSLALVAVLMLAVPDTHAYYTGTLANRLLFVVVTLVGLVAGLYLGAEAQRVEETML